MKRVGPSAVAFVAAAFVFTACGDDDGGLIPTGGTTPDVTIDGTTPDGTTPDVTTPDMTFPDFSIPDFSIPDFSIPDFSDLSIPDFSDLSIPDFSLPEMPDVGSLLEQMLPGLDAGQIDCLMQQTPGGMPSSAVLEACDIKLSDLTGG